MKAGVNFAVFVLFFGLALYEAIKMKNWLYAGTFLILKIISLFADNLMKK